jgi:hypothetical protein
MSAKAVRMVTLAIENLLKSALNLAGSGQTTFIGPLDDPGTKAAGLVLFLYRIAANQNLRNSTHIIANPADASQALNLENSLALDLHYLITVGPKEQIEYTESLRLLGYVIQALNDSPVLPGSQVGGEIIRLSLDPVSGEDISRVWALFPTVNYRTSLLYLASPVWVDPAQAPAQAANVVSHGFNTGLG